MWDPNVDFFTGSWIGWMIFVSLIMLACGCIQWVWRALFGKSK